MKLALILLSIGTLARPQASGPGEFVSLAAEAARARATSQTDQAIALYRRALALKPAWDEGWWSLGTLLYDKDAYSEAAEAFEHAARLNAKVGTTLVMLGLCEDKLGRPEDALRHLSAGRKLGMANDPQLLQVVLYREGMLLLDRGDFEDAAKDFSWLSRDLRPAEPLELALGMAAVRMRPAHLPADPSTRQLLRRIGHAEYLGAQKRLEEAMAQYRSIANESATARNVQFAYGRFLLANHHDEEALAAFRHELANTPGHLLARLGIAGIYARIDPAAGIPFAREAVRLNPQLPEAHYLLGFLFLESERVPEAIRELEIARRTAPAEAKTYFALGRAYALADRQQDAARARADFVRLTQKGNGQ